MSSELYPNAPDTLNELANYYNDTLAHALDRHAPLCTKVIKARPLVPWFNDDIKITRRNKRKAERKWRRTGGTEDMKNYKIMKNNSNKLMNEVRSQFYKNFIEENNFNQHKLFAAAKKLLNHGDKRVAFPPSVDKLKYVNQMGNYFVEKIHNIHTKLDTLAHELPEIEVYNAPETIAQLSNFNVLTDEDVRTLVKECGMKNSAVDPLPTSLVIDLIDVLLLTVTKIVNPSLESGSFADA